MLNTKLKEIANFSRSFKMAFLSAFVIGIITHIYIFTNLILNHDSVWRLYYDNENLGLGRWALEFFSDLSTQFQMPVVIGFISITMLALTSGLTVEVLDINNKYCVILVSAFLVTFPSVACFFSYMFTADAYFISLFLNTLAVYLTKRLRFGWIAGIIICSLACGIYQSFICYAIGLFLLDCIFRIFSDEHIKNIVISGIKYIAIVICSLVCYYIILKILLLITGQNLVSYQGLDAINPSDIKGLVSQIIPAYKNFIKYFIASEYLTSFYQYILYAVLIIFTLLIIYLVINLRIYKNKARLFLLCLGILLLPLAMNFITILAKDANVHALMIYAFVLLFVMVIKIVDIFRAVLIIKNNNLMFVSVVILLIVLVWNNFCISNMAYLRLQVCYENSYALANRIVTRIELLDGYSPDLPVAIVGEVSRKLYGNTVSEFSQINSLTGTADVLLYSPEAHRRTRNFIEHYIGLHMPKINKEQIKMLEEADILEIMGNYPDKNSIAIYNDIIIIKLSDGTIR